MPHLLTQLTLQMMRQMMRQMTSWRPFSNIPAQMQAGRR
jgi:hypothetical protein